MIIDKILLFFRPARRNFKFSKNSKFSKSKLQGLGKNIFLNTGVLRKISFERKRVFKKHLFFAIFRYFHKIPVNLKFKIWSSSGCAISLQVLNSIKIADLSVLFIYIIILAIRVNFVFQRFKKNVQKLQKSKQKWIKECSQSK